MSSVPKRKQKKEIDRKELIDHLCEELMLHKIDLDDNKVRFLRGWGREEFGGSLLKKGEERDCRAAKEIARDLIERLKKKGGLPADSFEKEQSIISLLIAAADKLPEKRKELEEEKFTEFEREAKYFINKTLTEQNKNWWKPLEEININELIREFNEWGERYYKLKEIFPKGETLILPFINHQVSELKKEYKKLAEQEEHEKEKKSRVMPESRVDVKFGKIK